MTRVVIESPLGAPTREGIEKNKEYARACVKDSIQRGEAPYASHLFFDQEGILNDMEPAERNLGLQMGLEWGQNAHLIAVYIDNGISNGMRMGIDFYRHLGIPVEQRYLYNQGKSK